MRFSSIAMMLALLACGTTVPDASIPEPAKADPAPEGKTFKQGLQYNGAVGARVATRQVVEISAPILPNSMVFQGKGGTAYPEDPLDRVKLVQTETWTYEALLNACVEKYPAITLRATDATELTPEQLRTNLEQVARCSYEQYYAKPYWMPQLLLDLDVCGLKLGAGWRLLAEADLEGLTETDYQLFQDTLAIPQGADWFPQHFYFSLDAYVLARDGSLKLANLAPGTQHLNPLPTTDLKALYVGNGRPIGLRCVRQTAVSE